MSEMLELSRMAQEELKEQYDHLLVLGAQEKDEF